jgi:hypothetical protein
VTVPSDRKEARRSRFVAVTSQFLRRNDAEDCTCDPCTIRKGVDELLAVVERYENALREIGEFAWNAQWDATQRLKAIDATVQRALAGTEEQA